MCYKCLYYSRRGHYFTQGEAFASPFALFSYVPLYKSGRPRGFTKMASPGNRMRRRSPHDVMSLICSASIALTALG